MDRHTDLIELWPLTGGADLRDALIAAYADPSRGYHNTQHLIEVLDRVLDIAHSGESFDQLSVLLAAWFHDAVYDGERDAEERSATWAEHDLPGLVEEACVSEVARLVRLTETHRPTDSDAEGCVLSDADLGILAAPADRYRDYVSAVRSEYAHLDDAVFNEGRADVLEALLSKPQLFHTHHGQSSWEQPARANVEAEIAALRAG